LIAVRGYRSEPYGNANIGSIRQFVSPHMGRRIHESIWLDGAFYGILPTQPITRTSEETMTYSDSGQPPQAPQSPTPYGQAPMAGTEDPGKTLGIVGFVLA